MYKNEMSKLSKPVINFIREEDGPTSVEYAVMLALIVVVCLTAIATVGNNALAKFCNVADALAAN
jgi:pilus assembly protein Flp/PilA